MEKIYMWADGSWCYQDEVESYMSDVGMSDDYQTADIPEHVTQAQVDDWVMSLYSKGLLDDLEM